MLFIENIGFFQTKIDPTLIVTVTNVFCVCVSTNWLDFVDVKRHPIPG